jgi:hypothetical protein
VCEELRERERERERRERLTEKGKVTHSCDYNDY